MRKELSRFKSTSSKLSGAWLVSVVFIYVQPKASRRSTSPIEILTALPNFRAWMSPFLILFRIVSRESSHRSAS